MSEPLKLLPDDEFNRKLVSNVHPPDWRNPEPAPVYNLIAIGGGAAGLVAAAGAAGLGAKSALIERHLLGGDCLNVGCVPSKTLIRAARAAHEVARAAEFGIEIPPPTIDFGRVMARVRGVRAEISAHDAATRFRDLGVDLFLGEARFLDRNTIEVDGKKLRFKKAVIATGARAILPPIPGLAEVGALTNETVFSLTERPAHLAVLGAGPIGCELAQAFRRLGSRVTLIEIMDQILIREDPDAAGIVRRSLRRDGVEIVLGARVGRVSRQGESKVLHL
ncbi:MAG: FAD-containing oxidoreductase, partial [Deltaproteobacteria bacterium]